MQPNLIKREITETQDTSKIYEVIESIKKITWESIKKITWEIIKESPFIEFVLHPSRFLNLLPQVYREKPELKRSIRIKRY